LLFSVCHFFLDIYFLYILRGDISLSGYSMLCYEN